VTVYCPFTEKLSGSRYGLADDIEYIAQCFDKTTKLGFNDSTRPAFIKFGTARDTEPAFDIKFGQLKLQGSVTPKRVENLQI
jgi:hypothetical protein